MELYQLRTFKMVAEERHLTNAAKRLNASQPAISAHIKALEDELGVTLFQRTPKGMTLTDEGLKLKEHAEKALSIVDDMVRLAGKLRGTLNGELRIGINNDVNSLRIPEFFSVMKTQHPNLHIHLLQCMTGEVLNKLENGILDAGFMYGENSSEKIISSELKRLDLVIVGPIAWHDRLMVAEPADLDQFPWIMTPVDCPFHKVASQLFNMHDLHPDQVVLVDHDTTIKSMIKTGTGISLLLEQDILQEEIEESLTIWKKERLSLTLSIACLRRRKDEQMLLTLISALSGVWAG